MRPRHETTLVVGSLVAVERHDRSVLIGHLERLTVDALVVLPTGSSRRRRVPRSRVHAAWVIDHLPRPVAEMVAERQRDPTAAPFSASDLGLRVP